MKIFTELFGQIKQPGENFFKVKFVRDTFILQWGSFWDLGLSFLASIIYARILGIGGYGDYALIFAFANLISLFLNWGTGYAILTLLAEAYARADRQEIKSIITYYFKISLMIFGTIGLLAVIFAPLLAEWLYHNPLIGELARLIIIASFCQVFFSLLTSLLQVMRKIKYLTVAENAVKFFSVALPVVLVLLGYGLAGIAWGYLIAITCSMFFAVEVYRHFSRRNNLVPHLREVLKNFGQVRVSRYLNYSVAMAVDNNLANSFAIWPVMILGSLAAPAAVANLKIAMAYLALPKIFLGPISRLLLVQLPKAKVAGPEHLRANFYKTSIVSGLAFFLLTLVFLFFAAPLIHLFYGQEFLTSTSIVYPLSLSVIFSGFTIGVGSLYRTLHKNLYGILINVAGLVSGFIIFYLLSGVVAPMTNIIILVVYWSWCTTAAHLFYLRRYLKKLA